jgi:hypothetical protein
MKTLKIALFSLALVSFAESGLAESAMLTGESVSGMNKICYYRSSRGVHAITIKAHQICPSSIDV